MGTIYDFSAKPLDGREMPLSNYRGQLLLVVNTASKCGFAPQYVGLEALYLKFEAGVLRSLAFPAINLAPRSLAAQRKSRNFAAGTMP